MNFLYDYGEVVLCVAPVFLVIALVFGGLLWNSIPDQTVKRDIPHDETDPD